MTTNPSRASSGQVMDGEPTDRAVRLMLDQVLAVLEEIVRGLALRVAHPYAASRVGVHRADVVVERPGEF